MLSTLHARCALLPFCAVTFVTRLLSKTGSSKAGSGVVVVRRREDGVVTGGRLGRPKSESCGRRFHGSGDDARKF